MLPPHLIEPKEENMFGKTKGRFCEESAKEVDRTLKDKALAALCAMPASEMTEFVEAFNKVFRQSRMQIVYGHAAIDKATGR